MLNRCAFRQSGFSFMGKFSVELGRSSHLLLFTWWQCQCNWRKWKSDGF